MSWLRPRRRLPSKKSLSSAAKQAPALMSHMGLVSLLYLTQNILTDSCCWAKGKKPRLTYHKQFWINAGDVMFSDPARRVVKIFKHALPFLVLLTAR